jgi:hypothetical protein
MNKNEFIKKLTRIKSATSVTGKRYSSIYVYGDRIEFVREHKTKPESISISELFDLYSNENSITTTVAKSYISGRVQSPAIAILNQFKNVSLSESISVSGRNDNNFSNKKEQKTDNKIKDETKFFVALSEIVGVDYIQSKSVNKPINSSHVFLSNNYVDFTFNQEINDCYVRILSDLKSNNLFSSDSLSHYVDGIIINHPYLKTRIVEFDEEQHFTPARKDTLKNLSNILPDKYFSTFDEICNNKEYLNEYVLKKHRIKNKLETVPKSFIEFTKWLEQSNEKSSGYICDKNGFEFLGGRIAQRAYYDCLRDTAHLSERNCDFDNPLRFAKKKFEDKGNTDFGLISKDRIKEIIAEILKNDYGITIPSA